MSFDIYNPWIVISWAGSDFSTLLKTELYFIPVNTIHFNIYILCLTKKAGNYNLSLEITLLRDHNGTPQKFLHKSDLSVGAHLLKCQDISERKETYI